METRNLLGMAKEMNVIAGPWNHSVNPSRAKHKGNHERNSSHFIAESKTKFSDIDIQMQSSISTSFLE
jgi:hypothetical protein